MTDFGPGGAGPWSYRFSQPGGNEIETGSFSSDDEAESHARDLSKSGKVPVIVHRLHGDVDWRYLTEADERA
ncbi:MAG: DUF2188 domain-containing protein [Acidimicrobiales bacterium]